MFKISRIILLLFASLLGQETRAQSDACPRTETYNSYTYQATDGLNNSSWDNPFTWVFDVQSCCTMKNAVLSVKMSANEEGEIDGHTCNDMIVLYIGDGNSWWPPEPLHHQWVYGPDQASTSSNMPTAVAMNQMATRTWTLTPTELAHLNVSHRVKLYIQDDSKVISAKLDVKECCQSNTPQSNCSTAFDLTATTAGMPSGYFSIIASNFYGPNASPWKTWDIPPGCSYWWEVKDLTANSASVGIGPTQTWDWYINDNTSGPAYPTINFPGYTSNGYQSTPAHPAGKFQIGHTYRITRGTWNCSGWHTESKTVTIAATRAAGQQPKAVVTVDRSYKPSQADVDKIIHGMTAGKK